MIAKALTLGFWRLGMRVVFFGAEGFWGSEGLGFNVGALIN